MFTLISEAEKGDEQAMRYLSMIPREIIESFLQQTSDLKNIQKLLEKYELIANRIGISLPIDETYEILIYPDGRAQVLLLDLNLAETGEVEVAKGNN